MTSKLSLVHSAFLLLSLFLVTTGCSNRAVPSTPQTTPTMVAPVPVSTLTPTKPLLTLTRISTPTSTPLPTNTPTLAPTPTRFPPEQAELIVLGLLENNGGCRLPCWWGIVPGQTTWKEAHDLLMPIAFDYIYIESPGGFTKSPKSNSFIASLQFPASKEIFPYYPAYNFTVQDGIVEYIETTPGNVSAYRISSILNQYGQPEEVWIRTYANSLDGDLPFYIVMFYPNQGIVASYYPEAKERANNVNACPQETFISTLGLWEPKHVMTFVEAGEVFRMDPEAWPFKRLEEATGIDEKQFFETFKDPDSTKCLETPADLWQSLP
jgi:hypothetical protein